MIHSIITNMILIIYLRNWVGFFSENKKMQWNPKSNLDNFKKSRNQVLLNVNCEFTFKNQYFLKISKVISSSDGHYLPLGKRQKYAVVEISFQKPLNEGNKKTEDRKQRKLTMKKQSMGSLPDVLPKIHVFKGWAQRWQNAGSVNLQ